MAQVLEELPKQTRAGGGGGREAMYPYDEWLDGQPRMLVEGTKEQVEKGEADYASKKATILNLLRGAAEARKVGLKSVSTPEGVAVQAVEYVPPEQRPKRGRPPGSKNGGGKATKSS